MTQKTVPDRVALNTWWELVTFDTQLYAVIPSSDDVILRRITLAISRINLNAQVDYIAQGQLLMPVTGVENPCFHSTCQLSLQILVFEVSGGEGEELHEDEAMDHVTS